MKNTAYDASAVNQYINELNSREAEITRSMRIQNFKREVPARVFLWCGYAVPIIIFILILGFAINKALSFERVEKTVIENTAPDLTKDANSYSSDVIIDVEKILNEEPTFPEGVGSDVEDEETVRNYVIFDNIPMNGEIIKQVVVGREYESPGSLPKFSWCYIEKNSHLGIKPSLNLVRVEEGNRSQNNLTAEIAEEFGVSLTELKNAQKKCNI